MSSSSDSYYIVLNISKTTTTRTMRTTKRTHTLPTTYPSIPHANAAVQREVKTWAPDHLRMTMHSFTEDGTWQFKFVGANKAEEVFVEAVIEKMEVDEGDSDSATKGEGEMHDSGAEEDGKVEKKGQGRAREKGKAKKLPVRSRSTAEERSAVGRKAGEGRVLRSMPHRKTKGKSGEEEEE